MPLKIIPPGQELHGTAIDLPTIVRMVQNFCDITHKNLGHGPIKVTIDKDSHAVHYTKAEIEALFAANPGSDGLRIYFAVHQHSEEEDNAMPRRPPEYIGHHTGILVSTIQMVDQLNVNNYISSLLVGGMGVEEGQICPPPKCGSGTVDNRLH